MKNVKTNFIYNSMYQLMIIIIPIVTTPYISRTLGAGSIGEYSYSYSIAYYFALFSLLGLNNYGNRTIATVQDNKEELSKQFCEIYIMQVITSSVMILLYIFYCIMIATNKLAAYIQIMFVISNLFDINWFFFGIEQFKATSIRSVFIKFLSIICIFFFVKNSEDSYKYMLIMSMSFLLTQLTLWPFLLKYINLQKVRFCNVRKHFIPNITLFIPILALSFYKIMDKIMLGYITNMSEVGFYENSEKIINIPLSFVTSLGTVMMPRMSNMIANKKNIKQLLEKSILFSMLLSTSMSFGIMSISKEFVPLFYGEGFDKCISIFAILLPSSIFTAFANVIRTQYLIPSKKDNVYIISIILGAITNFIINIIFIPVYGSIGAAIGTFFAEFVVFAYQNIRLIKLIPIKKYMKIFYRYLFCGICMFFLLCKLDLEGNLLKVILIKSILGIFIYVLLIIIVNIIIKQFIKIERKNESGII